MSYVSQSAAVRERLRAAVDAGLVAAATVVQAEVKRTLAPGYTSGAFVTGNVLNSVTVTAPHAEGDGRAIEIGTNVDYALYWELGHRNLFTRRFERQERWVPALFGTAEAQRAAIADAVSAASADARIDVGALIARTEAP